MVEERAAGTGSAKAAGQRVPGQVVDRLAEGRRPGLSGLGLGSFACARDGRLRGDGKPFETVEHKSAMVPLVSGNEDPSGGGAQWAPVGRPKAAVPNASAQSW